jgi:peptidoglycan/xylan/chitin deacetylase (PgdA/CDA1 family)
MNVGTASAVGKTDPRNLRLWHVPMVLMYHGVEEVSEDPYNLCVTPARFAEQMTWLAEHGLHGVSMGELLAAVCAGRARGLVGLTFDDGYLSQLNYAVPELQRHDFTATMFIISGLLGRTNEWEIPGTPVRQLMSAEQVIQIAAAGMEIASHSVTHPHLRGIDEERLRAEVAESKSSLAELLGQPVRGFAYPYGSMDATARQAVRQAGYDYACAVDTRVADLGITSLPRIVFGQRDGTGRLAARKMFYRTHLAFYGAKRELSYKPFARKLKDGLSMIAHPVRKGPD